MKIRDLIERVAWTAIAAAGANFTAVALLDVAAWKMGIVTGLVAAINAVTVIARWRLSVLPDPGAGLPGLPVDQPAPPTKKTTPAKKAAKKRATRARKDTGTGELDVAIKIAVLFVLVLVIVWLL